MGIDNLNPYYDPKLKAARIERLSRLKIDSNSSKWTVPTETAWRELFQHEKFDTVVHLARKQDVRYSLDHPFAYLEANLNGFLTVLEGCRHHAIKHLVSPPAPVYGSNQNLPFSVGDNVDHPISLYAATKKSNEHMAHVYAHLYGVPCTRPSVLHGVRSVGPSGYGAVRFVNRS